MKIAIAAGDERIYERLSGYMRKLLGGSAALRDIIYADFQDRKVTLHFKNGINQTVRPLRKLKRFYMPDLIWFRPQRV